MSDLRTSTMNSSPDHINRQRSYCCYLKGAMGSLCFIDDYCYEFYLQRLQARSHWFGVSLHAWALLPNEVFLLITPLSRSAIARWTDSVNGCFGDYFQQRFERSLRVFPSLKAISGIHGAAAVLNCQKFIEREGSQQAGFDHPGKHHWSSYSYHAFGSQSDLNGSGRVHKTSHPVMHATFGNDIGSKQRYRQFIASGFSEPSRRFLRRSLTQGKALGSCAAGNTESVEGERAITLSRRSNFNTETERFEAARNSIHLPAR